MSKVRADVRMVELGLTESREQAKKLILAGLVNDGTDKIDKPGQLVEKTKPLYIKNKKLLKYVSRGGFKLEHALKKFLINLEGKDVLDIGSSTGGFSDCALQNGAQRIIALDVGTNQLHWKIRNNVKVTVMENTNFKNVQKEDLPFLPDIVVCDVSFISLEPIFKTLTKIVDSGTMFIALIKPQFEVGYEIASKGKGFIKNEDDRISAINKVKSFAAEFSFNFIDIDESPITGNKKNNIEYVALFIKK